MPSWPPPPDLSRHFYKAHGLGNDYIVVEAGSEWNAGPDAVRLFCDRQRGPGADGIVVVTSVEYTGEGRARVEARMFNPDGSEFERSGNGLRVLGSWIARRGNAVERIEVHVGGDVVEMALHGVDGGIHDISVDMGRAISSPEAIGLDAERLWASMPGYDIVPVSVGNPHLVVLGGPDGHEVSEAALERLGPVLTGHEALANGANVQLARAISPGVCRALIWERGVGRTEASGTSSCAVAVAMAVRGLLDFGAIRVEMPGGTLHVDVTEELGVTLRGPVEEVCDGTLTEGMLGALVRSGRGS